MDKPKDFDIKVRFFHDYDSGELMFDAVMGGLGVLGKVPSAPVGYSNEHTERLVVLESVRKSINDLLTVGLL